MKEVIVRCRCPFCGSTQIEEKTETYIDREYEIVRIWLECTSCWARGGFETFGKDYPEEEKNKYHKRLIDRWDNQDAVMEMASQNRIDAEKYRAIKKALA